MGIIFKNKLLKWNVLSQNKVLAMITGTQVTKRCIAHFIIVSGFLLFLELGGLFQRVLVLCVEIMKKLLKHNMHFLIQ